MIGEALYREILRALPIVCVDIVVRDQDGRYLLVKRTNEPLKGEWYVVGGRLLLGENAEEGARRKIKQEIGVEVERLEFLGYYEDRFDRNSFESGVIYHTVSLVFGCRLSGSVAVRLDGQASEWIWAGSLPARFRVQRSGMSVGCTSVEMAASPGSRCIWGEC